MTEQIEIPAEILRAAIQAINNERAIVGAGNMKSETFATLALEAANVGALLAERDGLRERVGMALFQNGYDNGYTTDGAVEAIELMAAKIAELKAALVPFAKMDRPGCDLGEVACERGTACDMTGITSGDFRRAADALREAGE